MDGQERSLKGTFRMWISVGARRHDQGGRTVTVEARDEKAARDQALDQPLDRVTFRTALGVETLSVVTSVQPVEDPGSLSVSASATPPMTRSAPPGPTTKKSAWSNMQLSLKF